MGVSLRTNLPLENRTTVTMSPIHSTEELIVAMPELGDQDFNSFALDENILANPDQHIGDIEEMFRSMDEHKLSIFPEIEAEDFEDHNVEVFDSRVADYMWNGMDVKSSVTRSLVKTNVVVSSRPRSLLRCNLNAAPAPPPPPPVSLNYSIAASTCSDGGSDYSSEESSRPDTPPSDSDDGTIKVESMLPGLEDFSATHSVWGRNFVPESALLHSNDDEYANVRAVPVWEVTGQIIKVEPRSEPATLASAPLSVVAAASPNWIKTEDASPMSMTTTSCASSPVSAPASPMSSSPSHSPSHSHSRRDSPVAPRDAAAIAAATSNLFNDHSYPLNRNGYPGIPGNLTPSDSEEDEIDVVNVVKTRPSRSSGAALPNNPTANDRKVLQRTVASKISPPQTPAASPAPSPPPSPPRRTPAIMGGPSLNQMRADGERTLVRSKRECIESISSRRRREVKAAHEDEEHVRRLRQRETGFVPQPAPAPIRKEVRVVNHGMTIPSATELRPDWLVVCHNKRDRFRKSRARIEQDAWQNVQSVRKKHRQKQAMAGRRLPVVAPMSDMDSDEDSSSSRRGRGSNNARGHKRKLKRDLDSEERRSQHNHMERRRRVDLRESFEELRLQIPMPDGKAAKVAILEGAAQRIRCLQNVEEQLLDEEDHLLKEYFALRVRLLRLTLPARELEGWSDHDLVLHEVASAVEKMETAEGVCGVEERDDAADADDGVDVDDELDDDSDEDEEEEEVIRTPAPKRRRTRHRDSDSDSGDDDDYCY